MKYRFSIFLNLLTFQCILTEDLPGNRTDFNQCKVSHLGIDYVGTYSKTEGNIRCQSWATNSPVHPVHDSYTDDKFPEFSKQKAKNYCRNPSRNQKGPWCYTMDSQLIDDNCGVPLCSLDVCRLTGPGMEYGGIHRVAASTLKCLKWDKTRKKVRFRDNITVVEKFAKSRFPDESLEVAKKHCRNPDGDIAGPWCFVEAADSSEVIKEYCDIPFCDDQDCMMFTRNNSFYGHYLSFPKRMSNFSFGIKLWDPDSYLDAKATLVLSLLALPLSGKDIEEAGIGIEVSFSNLKTALTFGNKDAPEYEVTHGILKSTEYTFFSLAWDRGFITLNKDGDFKPIFLQEMKIGGNLIGFSKQKFRFYSAQGNNIIWSFPFCDDEDECDVHTTTSTSFTSYWPLVETDIGHVLKFHVRATESAYIMLVPSPVLDYPNIKLQIAQSDGFTRITSSLYDRGPTITLVEVKFNEIISYWHFSEFSMSIFSGTLSLYWNKDVGNFLILEVEHNVLKSVRWFSPGSENNVAHWTFNCKPPQFAQPKPAFLPECALDKKESFYIGTQDVTAEGTPCLPWSARKWIPNDIKSKVDSKTLLEMQNFCRDPLSLKNGTFCYGFVRDRSKVEKKYCKIRKCKSAECRMAGTGNDYIGKVNTTRSNRTCQFWVTEDQRDRKLREDVLLPFIDDTILKNTGPIVNNISDAVNSYLNETDNEITSIRKDKVHNVAVQYLNGTLYADMAPERAENYCRNPSRSIAGSWCYTLDPQVEIDACHVPDCDRNEECTLVVLGNGDGRHIYILPQWREAGHHGGLRFSLKQWNPDFAEGIRFELTDKYKELNITLNIGAENNRKINMYKNGAQLLDKTMPYIIPAGRWVSFWLQIRPGALFLGFEGVRDTLVEWIAEDPVTEPNPVFVSFQSIAGNPIGMFVPCDECHAENTTSSHFGKIMPINMWTTNEEIVFNNLTLQIRGVGHIYIRLTHVPASLHSYWIELHNSGAKITLTKRNGKVQNVVHTVQPSKTILKSNAWTTMNISFTEKDLNISFNGTQEFSYTSPTPMLFYYFVIAIEGNSWITWMANCDPLDIDGPPTDGGWSKWSPWQCSVTCGGGDGYKTRTCNNPRPNIFGQLCHGDHTSTGKCNEFECGDLSPDTFDLIRENLQKSAKSLIVKQAQTVTIPNDEIALSAINNESPDAFYEWTLNGHFLQPEAGRIYFQGDDIVIKDVSQNDSGVYTCILFRINSQKVIIRVVTLAVESARNTIVTRATLPMLLNCKSLTLGYVYSDLTQKWMLNKSVYIDYGVTTLAAVNFENVEKTNRSLTGIWTCIVGQPDLNLQWTTNIEMVLIKRAPNFYTHLKEDPLTRPIFGKLPNDAAIITVIITFVVLVFAIVGFLLYAYLNWGTLPENKKKNRSKYKKRNRRFQT